MGAPKKRTPRAVERAAANRVENETRRGLNVVRLDELGRGVGSGGERPSRTLRRLKREQARRESAVLLERIDSALSEVPEGGDVA